MKPQRVRSVVKQVGWWILLVLITAVFTVLFSILGTITVSVFAGVAIGASRRWQWRAIPVSMAFLLVGLALTHVAKAGLDFRQRVSMAGLSFGAFWLTYFLALALMLLEKKGHAQPGPIAPEPLPSSEIEESSKAACAQTTRTEGFDGAVESEPISVHELEGKWFSEAKNSETPSERRLMDISDGKFIVRVLSANGTVRVVAEGTIELE